MRVADAPAKGHQRPWTGLARRNSSTNCPISHSPRPRRLVTGAARDGGRPRSRIVASIPPPCTRTVLDRLRVAGPIQDGVGGGLADGQDQVVDNLARDGSWQRLQAASNGTPQPGKAGRRGGNRDVQLLPPAGVAAVVPWWGVLQTRVVQLRHREGVGPAWRQPSRSPRQGLPAVTVMARSLPGGAALHRPPAPPQPVQLRRQRPAAVLQILQVAVAVEGPAVDGARPAAPVAGLRGARTGVVGFGPAAAFVALVEPGSGRDADLPGPARRPAGHQVSPPLAWLPGSDQPTKQTGTAQPEPHGTPTVLPTVGPAGHRLDAANDPKAQRPARPRPRPRPEVGPGPSRAVRVPRRPWDRWPAPVGYGASLDSPRGPTSTPGCCVPSSSLRRRAFSRSSSATLPSTSRRATRSCRRLARRALDELQAIRRNSASSRPSPAATSSSSPWVKRVIDWSKTDSELALVLVRATLASNAASTTASTRKIAAIMPPMAVGGSRVEPPRFLARR